MTKTAPYESKQGNPGVVEFHGTVTMSSGTATVTAGPLKRIAATMTNVSTGKYTLDLADAWYGLFNILIQQQVTANFVDQKWFMYAAPSTSSAKKIYLACTDESNNLVAPADGTYYISLWLRELSITA